ncbi:MAG: molybdenum cofactor biosynthesis protein MoaE [Desulfomonile tiedjei]|uniref:Molybdopterin synthase catalytic subunit n=1 Tax=Desulfomonile tiedjei TaxID=2358 RepID=A0A9D6V0U3_9BACT|nr:molybdenum cofactor biosynthesis protein MoaE [Desulfomonile tiedjei]
MCRATPRVMEGVIDGKRGVIVGAHSVSLADLLAGIKAHPEISRAGMILCHNGIVRESDRSGSKHVRALRVNVDRSAIERIRSWGESRPGIVAVAIEAFEGEFQVGDDLLFVVVAGDVRENVFAVTREIVEKIKSEGVHKTEFYDD